MVDNMAAERALREAAEWLASLNTRHVDQDTLDAFFEWHRDPENAAAYASVEKIWEKSRHLGGDRDIALAVRDALARPLWSRRLMGLQGAVRQRPVLTGLVALLLVITVAGLSWLSMLGTLYSTATGEQRLIQLADGSSIRLDTQSRVRVKIGQHTRRIELLGGQALFSVAHDPARPFVVHVGDADITAVGTRFDVRGADTGAVSVALIQGRLALATRGSRDPTVDLEAGRGATFDAQGWGAPQSVDVDAITGWSSGRLQFQDAPLDQTVREMNRYTTHRVMLAGDVDGSQRVSGNFTTDDINGFVTAISTLYRLTAHSQSDGTILLSH